MSLDIDLYYEVEPGVNGCVYSANITHNLGTMAAEAGIYRALWHSDGVSNAGELAAKINGGIRSMMDEPERYKAYDSPNGWGLYRNFLPWLIELSDACAEHPTAKLWVSR